MHMDAFLWMFLPVFVAAGSALLSFCIMQAKMEVALAKERESLAEARSTISSQKITLEERIKATEEATKRHALDEFMQDFRVEERSYVRESKSLSASKKTMVMQERLFFRNIPLSNWIEREMIVEEGRDLDQIAKDSVFSTVALGGEEPTAISKEIARTTELGAVDNNDFLHRLAGGAGPVRAKFLDDLHPEEEDLAEPTALVATHAIAFGAQ
jgi:hypothetical protein